VRVFGSVARGDAVAGSDLDLVVDFDSGRSLMDHGELVLDLEAVLGCRVDVGGDFYVVFLYGDVPDASEFLRTARSVWLEIKSDNVEQLRPGPILDDMKILIATLVMTVTGSLAGSLAGCGGGSSKPDAHGGLDGAGANLTFSVAACQATICGGAATLCSWGSQDTRYLGCLSDCGLVGVANVSCPDKVSALWTCVTSDSSKVDCTGSKGTGCTTQEQAVAPCLLGDLDAGPG